MQWIPSKKYALEMCTILLEIKVRRKEPPKKNYTNTNTKPKVNGLHAIPIFDYYDPISHLEAFTLNYELYSQLFFAPRIEYRGLLFLPNKYAYW